MENEFLKNYNAMSIVTSCTTYEELLQRTFDYFCEYLQDYITKHNNEGLTGKELWAIYSVANDRTIWEAFCMLEEAGMISESLFSDALLYAYTQGRADFRAKEYFSRFSMDDCTLHPEEIKDFYESLPEEVTIYRGCAKEEFDDMDLGLSWTTDRGVAEFFAFRFSEPNRVVIASCAPVPKKYFTAVYTGRSEAEVIANDYIFENYSIDIVTGEPTEHYHNFMKNKEH